MSKNLRIKVAEYGAQQLEALGMPERLELELADGTVVEVLHPWLWDDKTEAAVKAATLEEGDEPYNTRYARAVLGKKEHDRFIKGGGKSSQIALAVAMMKRADTSAKEDDDPKD